MMNGSISKKADVIANLLTELDPADKGSVLMVGDRDQDILGAKENGLTSLGVLWGYGPEEELRDAGAGYLAVSPADVADYF